MIVNCFCRRRISVALLMNQNNRLLWLYQEFRKVVCVSVCLHVMHGQQMFLSFCSDTVLLPQCELHMWTLTPRAGDVIYQLFPRPGFLVHADILGGGLSLMPAWEASSLCLSVHMRVAPHICRYQLPITIQILHILGMDVIIVLCLYGNYYCIIIYLQHWAPGNSPTVNIKFSWNIYYSPIAGEVTGVMEKVQEIYICRILIQRIICFISVLIP